MDKELLLRHVHLTNEANRISNELLKEIYEKANPMVGTVIATHDSLNSKCEKILKPIVKKVFDSDFKLNHYNNIKINIHYANIKKYFGSLVFGLSLNMSDSKGSVIYKDITIHIGSIDDKKLIRLHPFVEEPTNITYEQQMELISQYQEAYKKYKELEHKIKIPFEKR